MEGQRASVGDFDLNAAIKQYQILISGLSPLHRQLLLYLLDFLAIFASKSDINKMTTALLAGIFQPGILHHPSHEYLQQERRLSQDVLIFLIENQDNFLISMQGTDDSERVQDTKAAAKQGTGDSNKEQSMVKPAEKSP